jgi:hypothetical protein
MESLFKKYFGKKEEDPLKDIIKQKDNHYYIEKFNNEEMISYEPLYTPPEVPDAEYEGMTEKESLKTVKNIKEKIENGTMKSNLFHKVPTKAFKWIDCFSNPWPSCIVGDQEVLKSQPVGVLKWNNEKAWELRKQNIIKGPSIEGKAGNKRKVE